MNYSKEELLNIVETDVQDGSAKIVLKQLVEQSYALTYDLKIEAEDGERFIYFGELDGDFVAISFGNDYNFQIRRVTPNGGNSAFQFTHEGIRFDTDSVNSKGFTTGNDYSQTASDLDYVQKKYVDAQKGVLENKTTAQILTIENPEIGKQYFNLDNNCVCYYNGSDWKKVISENL